MRAPTLNNPILYIFCHHTAVSRKLNPDQWNQTNAYHQLTFNFLSSMGKYVGYTYEIAANGTLRQARQEGEETAAVIGFNRQSISICLDGNFDSELPTPEQAQTLRALLIEIQARHDVPVTNILPHRSECGNPPYKTCYGKLLADDWAQKLVLDPASLNLTVDPNHPALGSTEQLDDFEAA